MESEDEGEVPFGTPRRLRGHVATDHDEGTVHRRSSDPMPPQRLSTASGCSSAASTAQPRRLSSGSASGSMRHTQSWEFPLSREEKKHRVICLFEQELAQAHEANRRSSLQTAAYSKESPGSCRPSRPSCTPSSPGEQPSASRQSSEADSSRAFEPVAAPPPLPLRSSWWPLATLLVCLAIAVALVVVFLLVFRSDALTGVTLGVTAPSANFGAAEPYEVPAANVAMQREAAPVAAELDAMRPAALPPLVFGASPAAGAIQRAERVRALREQGLHHLRLSECLEADRFFAAATKELGPVEDPPSQSHLLLLGDRGFSLVCGQRFVQGVDLINERVLRGGHQLPAHLINALGFAEFSLEDFERADAAFSWAVQVDPDNPILWNNLAAVKMVRGEIEEADDAMDRTFAKANSQDAEFEVQQYHLEMFESNMRYFMGLVSGDTALAAVRPSVELWWPG